MATPTAKRPRSTERMQRSEIGPICAATMNPSTNPAANAAGTRGVYDRGVARWNELDRYDGPWIDAFVLMWEAYEAGTIPVGAVVADETGRVVARGRNRIFDEPDERQLGRTRLAHAEINALASLSSDRTYDDWTLYTALEPCHVCLAAAFSTRIGRLCFASADAYGGAVGKLVPSRDHTAHPVRVEGPLDGPAGLLPEALLVGHCLWRRPEGDVVRFYRDQRPDLVELAASLPPPSSGGTLPGVYAAAAATCR
jgi:tRNA(Arg) A34 adenosine deaminase TadA